MEPNTTQIPDSKPWPFSLVQALRRSSWWKFLREEGVLAMAPVSVLDAGCFHLCDTESNQRSLVYAFPVHEIFFRQAILHTPPWNVARTIVSVQLMGAATQPWKDRRLDMPDVKQDCQNGVVFFDMWAVSYAKVYTSNSSTLRSHARQTFLRLLVSSMSNEILRYNPWKGYSHVAKTSYKSNRRMFYISQVCHPATAKLRLRLKRARSHSMTEAKIKGRE